MMVFVVDLEIENEFEDGVVGFRDRSTTKVLLSALFFQLYVFSFGIMNEPS